MNYAALRVMCGVESDKPEFHGPHINYADVLFSPATVTTDAHSRWRR